MTTYPKPDWPGPYHVEQHFGTDSYIFQVVGASGHHAADYEDESAAKKRCEYLNIMQGRPWIVPALMESYPGGCPDRDWCAGNKVCYWDCVDQGPDFYAGADESLL